MSSSPSSNVHSNLQRLLYSVTPSVPTRPVPQSCMQDSNRLCQPLSKRVTKYFTLEDLWECYDEWSAYGVGISVALKGREDVQQYFAPTLSAIQIYTKSPVVLRNPRDYTSVGVEPGVENSSNDDIDSESDSLSRSLSNNSSKGWESTSSDSSSHETGSWSKRALNKLYFQYYDICSPYTRNTLVERVVELAESYPGIVTLKDVDLSPASWMAVAWYPIYHIPAKGTVNDLSACFLTFHALTSCFEGPVMDNLRKDIGRLSRPCPELLEEGKCKEEGSSKICLPPFGLATYKMLGDIWLNRATCDTERMAYLYCAADAWLKQLNFPHHDFNFFTFH